MRAPNALIFFYPQTKSFIYPYCNCICMEMFPRWLSRSLNLAATHAPGSYWSPNWGLSKIPASLSRLIFVSLFCSIFVFRCVEGWRRVRKMRTMHPPVANDNLNVGGWTHWDSQPKHNTCISCVSFSGRDNHNPSAHLHSLWTFYESKMCLSAALLFVWMMNCPIFQAETVVDMRTKVAVTTAKRSKTTQLKSLFLNISSYIIRSANPAISIATQSPE